MKTLAITSLAISVLISSCGSSKTEPTEKGADQGTTEVVSKSGADLFTSSGCVACHQPDAKTVGPSVKEISTAYNGNKEGLNQFFLGEGPAIVDPAQEAVMQPQTELTKAMSDEDRSSLADYILNI